MVDKTSSFTKRCPACLVELNYKSIASYKNALKKDSTCRKCARKKQICPEETRRKKSATMKGRSTYKPDLRTRLKQRVSALKRYSKDADIDQFCSIAGDQLTNYFRNCPTCNSLIEYTNSDHLRAAQKLNSECRSCAQANRELSEIAKHHMSKAAYKRYGTEPRKFDENLNGRLTAWARAIKKRDGYECFICRAKENLEAHHVLSRAKHPQYALCLWNGITFCTVCHLNEHRQAGLV